MIYDHCDIVYSSKCIIQSYKIFFSAYIQNSNNLRFCTNMIGCSNCIDCDNLTNQSYCIKNISYTKDDYEKKLELLMNQKEQYEDIYHHILKRK